MIDLKYMWRDLDEPVQPPEEMTPDEMNEVGGGIPIVNW